MSTVGSKNLKKTQKEKGQLLIYHHVHHATRYFILTQKPYIGLRLELVLLL